MLYTDGTMTEKAKKLIANGVGIDNIKLAVEGITGNEAIAFSDPSKKQYINTSGTTASWDTPSVSVSVNYKWAVVECAEGDVFTINGHGGQSSRLWAFCNSNKTILDPRAEQNATGDNLVITAPENAAYLIINDDSDLNSYVGNLAINQIKDNANKIDSIFASTVSLHDTTFANGYISLSGSIIGAENRAYTLSYIPKEIRQIIAKNGYKFRLHAYDSEDTYIGTYTTAGSFGKSGSSANLDFFDLNQYEYAHYKLSVLKTDDSVVDASAIGDNYYVNSAVVIARRDVKISEVEPTNLCLCGIRTAILDSKIPYHSGFLFHKYDADADELFFGTSLDNAVSIGKVGRTLLNKQFAISPKDGSVIFLGGGENLCVYKNGLNTSVRSVPRAWLYNSGIDFVEDGQGNEYCIYAEYGGNAGGDMNVWRGQYPYTSRDDWNIVLTVTGGTDINHFHQVRRDPWTGILYLTSGDSNELTHWWYSTDYGANWTELVSGTDVLETWGDSACRCINFVFTEDWIYWATDHYTNHILCKIARDATTGVIDLSTFEKLADLKPGCATNSICYSQTPHGLFMYERIDNYATAYYGKPVTMQFYDLDSEELKDVVTLGLVSGSTWGGSRGKCYVNYANPNQPHPAMGFASETPCIFDLVYDDVSKIGTVVYSIDGHSVKTVLL